MGYGSYLYSASVDKDTGETAYARSAARASFTAAVASGTRDEIFTQSKSRVIHEDMNPNGVKFRECRDSAEHPNSLPLIVAMDVTGSMGIIPHELVKSGLPTLMGTISQNGINDASLLFMAIGDHECDRFPLQAGQFESGDAELDMWLTRTYLEGGGGGNAGESYLLAWDFAANHTKTDAWEKRKKKGYLFTFGDEPCLPSIPASAGQKLYGESYTGQGAAKKENLLKAAQEMYNVYHLHVMHSYTADRSLQSWKDLLGQHCVEVADYNDIPKVISKIILDNEGIDTSFTTKKTKPSKSKTEVVTEKEDIEIL
jgi:hypothetical protein